MERNRVLFGNIEHSGQVFKSVHARFCKLVVLDVRRAYIERCCFSFSLSLFFLLKLRAFITFTFLYPVQDFITLFCLSKKD